MNKTVEKMINVCYNKIKNAKQTQTRGEIKNEGYIRNLWRSRNG